ncbi:MAG: hypothetical protein J7K40_08490 [candidate division Zixibacteria bacterium]|nr:hypothetical protein [candidate division Zixibacteria bacterium]
MFNLKKGSISKFGFKKFYKLASNSFIVKNYSLAVDNCRHAANIALSDNNLKQAAKAFELWIKVLFEDSNYYDIKKVCCLARSKFGNNLDSLYYELIAAINKNDFNIAAKLAKEFIALRKSMTEKPSGAFNNTYNQLDEILILQKKIESTQSENKINTNRSKLNEQKK